VAMRRDEYRRRREERFFRSCSIGMLMLTMLRTAWLKRRVALSLSIFGAVSGMEAESRRPATP